MTADPTLDEDQGAELAEPRDPWITEPGHYPDVDEVEYHRDPVVGGSLSSGGARALTDQPPARFAYDREHGRLERKAWDVGRAAHAEVLGSGAEVVVVTGTGADPNAWRTNADKAAVAAVRAAGHTPVTPADREVIDGMAAALRAHPAAGPLFAREGKAEQTYVARDPESGVMCRCRIDWLVDTAPGERLIVVDYKSARTADPVRGFPSSVAEHGYDQQDPFYLDVLHWLGMTKDADGREVEPLFLFVAQEKTPPYLVTVNRVRPEDRDRGRLLNRKARDVFAECTASGVWPGYEERVHDLTLPGWRPASIDAGDRAGRYLTRSDRDDD